jgi:hypothetical protein
LKKIKGQFSKNSNLKVLRYTLNPETLKLCNIETGEAHLAIGARRYLLYSNHSLETRNEKRLPD